MQHNFNPDAVLQATTSNLAKLKRNSTKSNVPTFAANLNSSSTLDLHKRGSANQSNTSLLSLSYAITGGEENSKHTGSLQTADQVLNKNHNFSKVMDSTKALENVRRLVTEELPSSNVQNGMHPYQLGELLCNFNLTNSSVI